MPKCKLSLFLFGFFSSYIFFLDDPNVCLKKSRLHAEAPRTRQGKTDPPKASSKRIVG